MKKLKLIFSMLLICSMLNAQTDWHLTGNNCTDPTTDFVGTTDANDLSFWTSNTVKMQLETTGELGLGTTSPSSWFHVLTNGSGTVDAKEVFRTEVATNAESNWRMIKGSNNMKNVIKNSDYDRFFIGSEESSDSYRDQTYVCSNDNINSLNFFNFEDKKRMTSILNAKSPENSEDLLVAGIGLEPMTFGL